MTTSEPKAEVAARAERLLADRARTVTSEDEARQLLADAAILRRLLLADRFTPYPWQHPHIHPEAGQHGPDCRPECTNPHIPVCGPSCADLPRAPVGTHGMWLQLGGRGTGKTEGAARYMDDHVRGPACDSRLPGGHRMLIVAPTQGDGAESCYSGPSGLRVVNPQTRLIGGSGGLRVRWPNGAVARILGAYGPEDVERLRAAGNNSLPTGTLIETRTGPKVIEQVQVGEYVWTHAGLRRVISTQNHGMKPTVTATTCTGRTLTCTPDHEVWTDVGWVDAEDLLGRTVTVWNMTDTNGTGSAPTGQGRQTTGKCCCTATSTSSTMDPSRTDGTSTTVTTTSPTTTQTTSSLAPPLTTGTLTIPTTPSGIGRVGWPRSAGLPESANSAAGSTEGDPGAATAPSGATGTPSVPLLPPSGCGHVSCAVDPSLVRLVRPPSPVHEHVVTLSHGPAAEQVWDLTVAGAHAFVAEGVLVANCLVWMEELAAQRHLQDALDHTAMGLRIGSSPHYVASTTPKPRSEIRNLLASKTTVITKGKTRDAVRLDPTVLQSYLDKYEGTRQGRQELDAELLDDVEGALWSLSAIDADRHKGPLPTMDKIVVAVDPPGSSTGKGNAEAGIVVVGMVNRWRDPFTKEPSRLPHGFVLADLSGKMTPEEWGRTAVDAYHRYGAATIAVETAYGGEMVLSTIRTIDDTVPVAKVPTKVGKKLRAEPVVSLYEQHRVHHVGILVGLETQQTEWVPGETPESPDRLDALVHGLTYLLVKHGGATATSAVKTRIPGSSPTGRGGRGTGPVLPRPDPRRRLQG